MTSEFALGKLLVLPVAIGLSMLRIWFSSSDLDAIRISVSPLFQTITEALAVGPGEPTVVHDAQSRLVRRAGRPGAPLARLLELDGFHVPDFLTPSPVSDDIGIGDELDLATSAPAWRVARDSRHLEPFTGHSEIADALVAGDRRVGARVIGAVLAFHRAAYGDSWGDVHRRLHAEANRRRRDFEDHGLDYLLSTIHPSVHWRRPVLTISGNSYDGEYERHGQGIVLLPGIGRMRTVTTMINPWEPVTIGYPIATHTHPDSSDAPTSPQLVRLLGRTRARVLVAIGVRPDSTTTELAANLGISVASASEHASTLRSVGLITSTRDRNGVRHSLLPLGSGLIRAAAAFER